MPRPSSMFANLFGTKAPPATQNPFWLGNAPPTPPQSSSCCVCHGAIGRGQATVTSECNHTFHLRCISGSVCPVCSAHWRDEVTVTPSQPRPVLFPLPPNLVSPPPPSFNFPPPSSSFPKPPMPSSTPSPISAFSDDEPVEASPLDGWEVVQEHEAANNGVCGELVLKTHCEHPAVARDAVQENFAVLLHAKAPAAAAEASERAPLDLVTVLDISGSMSGSKLGLLKQAMGFVIDHLGSGDRLSIVTFSCRARRIIRLTRMTDGGQAVAKDAVESLIANGTTNIGDGLRVAAEVLDGRRQRNAVASVILLSDGQDNHHSLGQGGYGAFSRARSYIDLVPQSLRRGDGNRSLTVHTFGFGIDHDAAAMHAIAEATGGTFSFIQDHAVVQDSFAQCIGGLLSVAVQEARVAVECLQPGVRVRTVKSGRYESRVDTDGRTASVDVGELYADEERRFLLLLDVPVAAGDGSTTRLVKVSCTYRDAATRQTVDVSCEDAVVKRPVVVVAGMAPSVEVARERFRVEAAEDIAAARAAAERGAHGEAARILDRRREASAAAGLAGDARCAALVAELRELSARVADRREYEQTGRACMLAGISSHAQQRASTVQLFGSAVPVGCGRYAGVAPPGAAAPPATFGTGASSSSPFMSGPPVYRRGMPAAPTCGAAPTFGAAYAGPAPTFGAAYATPAMQGMVESSKKRREQRRPR
ncbi:hypothetical protein SETIT_5G384000v2 [Setaria italica]|uniref:VWFA domain-containing protein n=1 Tax=Setaria italica TaxID=4555 RepID=A0A368RF10_SETIT|nr:hypothetical protein SETIT_5G384000v2 [Setaria italica]